MASWTARQSVRVTGIDELVKTLREFGRAANDALEAGMYGEGEAIMLKSKQIVPVDTGNLRASGHVRLPKRVKGRIVVVLGYGGAAADYAYHVHEDLRIERKPGQQAKYLEDPALEAIPGMPDRIAVFIRRAMEGRSTPPPRGAPPAGPAPRRSGRDTGRRSLS